MPYFKNENIHLLHIHIPKSGGSSVNEYFSNKFNIPLDKNYLYVSNENDFYNGVSLQHQTYPAMKKNPNVFPIAWEDPSLQVISVVRNPYHRMISDMLWHGFITPDTTPYDCNRLLTRYFNANWVDDHNIPQCRFVTTTDGKFIPGLKILKTETLKEDMHELGFTDFDMHVNEFGRKKECRDYMTYFNSESLNRVNTMYQRDFALFDYEMQW